MKRRAPSDVAGAPTTAPQLLGPGAHWFWIGFGWSRRWAPIQIEAAA